LHFKAPEWFLFAGRWLLIAICHLTWLYGRKYGTVWYHPTSSKFWNLTTLSSVNFQEKLTGTSWNLFACEASLFGLLCAWRKVQILHQQVTQEKRKRKETNKKKPQQAIESQRKA
jgi:hypothetical protein